MLRPSLAFLFFPLGCGLGLLDDLLDVPVCDGQATDPECMELNAASTSSGNATPTTFGADEGLLTSTVATLPDLTAGTSTDGPAEGTTEEPPAVAPMIVKVNLDPDTLAKAATIALEVQTLNAAEVTIALDGAEPVSLAKIGADVFKGAIEVYGSSMNGQHTVMIEASNAGQFDTQPAYFDVNAPPAGLEHWARKKDPTSRTRAIAVDVESNVYELGTTGEGASSRIAVSKRDVNGTLAWSGMWITYLDMESRGEDIAVGPDGIVYVLGNLEDKDQHTRWWLAKLDPDAGALVGEPEIGEIDEPARGLSIAENGDLAIVGYVTVWGEQNTEDIQTKVWFRPAVGDGFAVPWGYSPDKLKNKFAEVPEDILIDGQRIFVVGSVEGRHPDDIDQVPRKRLFVFEMNFNGQEVRPPYVASNTQYARSGGYALAIDGKGGIVSAGWACDDDCTQVGEIRWFDGELKSDYHQLEIGNGGPAYTLDIAYSPSGYNVVASAASIGAGFNLGLHVTGRRANDPKLVFDYLIDTKETEMAHAVAVGPHGFIWFGGLQMVDNTLRGIAGRLYGY